jgi:hypothetical protein
VTALDQLGNESAPSTTFEISFTVAPVKDLVLSKVDSGKPALTWSSSESDLQGYHVYRNAVRITQAPTVTAAYTDGYYSGKSVVYGVSQVNSLGQESPIKEVVFNELSIRLPEGTTLRRGILETVSVVLSSSMDTAVSTIEMSVGGGAQSNLSGPFVLTAGNSLTLQKVAATDANAPSQTPVTLTAVRNPSPGVTIRTTQTSLANVVGSGTALEIFSEPLTKGGLAKIQLKVNNVGTARMEFLTSQNGPTSEITVLLKDQDGNVLGQGNLDQRTDDFVHIAAGAEILARARQNNRLDVVGVNHIPEHVPQLGIGFQSQRVLPFGPVECDRRNLAFALPDKMARLEACKIDTLRAEAPACVRRG